MFTSYILQFPLGSLRVLSCAIVHSIFLFYWEDGMWGYLYPSLIGYAWRYDVFETRNYTSPPQIGAMPGRCDPFVQRLGLCWMVISLPVITRLNWTHLVNEFHESVISHMKMHEACLVKSWNMFKHTFHVITSSYPLYGEICETGWVPVSIPSNDECKHRCCQGDWTEPGR